MEDLAPGPPQGLTPFPYHLLPSWLLAGPCKGAEVGRGLPMSQMRSLRPKAAGEGHAQGQEVGHSPGLHSALPAPCRSNFATFGPGLLYWEKVSSSHCPTGFHPKGQGVASLGGRSRFQKAPPTLERAKEPLK